MSTRRADGTEWNTGLEPWTPYAGKTRDMLLHVLAILNEWVGSGVVPSLTSRAILYRLLPLGWSKNDVETLGVVLTRGRRSGKIPFEWIADGRSENYFPTVWESAEAFTAQMRKEAEAFRLPPLRGQPNVELWVESAGMIQMLTKLADELGTAVYCSSGYPTLTAKYDASTRLLSNFKRGTAIIFVGDLDPDGESRYENIERDVTTLAADQLVKREAVANRAEGLGVVRACCSFEVAAITRAQVAEHAIPTEPAKPRGLQRLPVGWAVGDPTAQAEALPPDAILLAIRTAVESHLDQDVLAQTRRDELEARAQLLSALEQE
jgi:hypothetical protein